MSELLPKSPKLPFEGRWPDASWTIDAPEVYEAQALPELRKTVMLVPFRADGKVVLMLAKRGWGLIGGHRDPVAETGELETERQTLDREAGEEGGLEPCDPELFAIRKIINNSGSTDSAGNPYPEESYMMIYRDKLLITDDSELAEPTGHEVLDRRSFTLEEVAQLELSDPNDLLIIQLAADGYITA